MNESEIVKLLEAQNDEFKRLGEEHKELEKLLADMQGRIYLTPEEELEKKRLQKLKLQKKDRRAELLNIFKKSQSFN